MSAVKILFSLIFILNYFASVTLAHGKTEAGPNIDDIADSLRKQGYRMVYQRPDRVQLKRKNKREAKLNRPPVKRLSGNLIKRYKNISKRIEEHLAR